MKAVVYLAASKCSAYVKVVVHNAASEPCRCCVHLSAMVHPAASKPCMQCLCEHSQA